MYRCIACPSGPTKYLIFMIAPVLLLAFFPFIKYLIAGGRVPSLYVTITYFQISAVCVCCQNQHANPIKLLQTLNGFAINWPTDVRDLLTPIGLVNFNWSWMFFGCYENRPTFMENWILFQLLPIVYALFFFSRHYFYKLTGPTHSAV